MKTTKTDTAIVIKPVEIQTVNIRIRGISPLIVHNWAVKEKREMLEKQTGANKGKKKHTYANILKFIKANEQVDALQTVIEEALAL